MNKEHSSKTKFLNNFFLKIASVTSPPSLNNVFPLGKFSKNECRHRLHFIKILKNKFSCMLEFYHFDLLCIGFFIVHDLLEWK